MQTPYELIVATRSGAYAMLPAALAQMQALNGAFDGRRPSGGSRSARRTTPGGSRGTAVIGVQGALSQRAELMEFYGLGTSCQTISSALRAALDDDTVSKIVLDIDSPGGSVSGVSELAAEILAARATKPIIAVANSMAASAAYWIGSSCSEFYCTPSGQVGSIGVISQHDDMSVALEIAGVKTTLITAGKYKAEGNPLGPLDPDARRNTQAMIDSYYADFTNAVAKGRGVSVDAVRANMGQGRMLRATEAMHAQIIRWDFGA